MAEKCRREEKIRDGAGKTWSRQLPLSHFKGLLLAAYTSTRQHWNRLLLGVLIASQRKAVQILLLCSDPSVTTGRLFALNSQALTTASDNYIRKEAGSTGQEVTGHQ
ncbi:hypothetical protein WAI453_012727 [Rhynchosporium graminicola]